ncbi:MAG: alpha/beta hydrolase [Aureliella sp.]
MTLHPSAVALLQSIKLQGRPSWPELPVEESRSIFSGLEELFGERPDVESVRELHLENGVQVRCYQPHEYGAPNRPAIMYFHGGGWVLGTVDTHDALCRRLSIASRRVVCSVDYRLAPENRYPSAMEDCYSASKLVLENAADLRVDSNRLALAGDSAGGNLAAAVSIASQSRDDLAIESQALIYPVVSADFETESYQAFGTDHMLTRETMMWFWKQYLGDLDASTIANASLADLSNASLEGLPRTCLMVAEYDVLRSEGERFARRLSEAGVSVDFQKYDGMLHGFVHFSAMFEAGTKAIDYLGAFFQESQGSQQP